MTNIQRLLLTATPVGQSVTMAYLLANYPASGYPNYEALVSDIGVNPIKLRSNGTRWLPAGGSTVLRGLAARVSAAGAAAETIAFQHTFPAGTLKQYDRLVLRPAISKAGTTTTGTITYRFGTAGTTGDTSVSSWVILSAANRSVGAFHEFRVESDTTIAFHGSQAATAGNCGFGAAANSGGYVAPVTVSGMTANAMVLSVSITPGATDAVALEDCQLTWEVS